MNKNRQKIIEALSRISNFIASLGDQGLTEFDRDVAYGICNLEIPSEWKEPLFDLEYDCVSFLYSSAPVQKPDWIECPVHPEMFREEIDTKGKNIGSASRIDSPIQGLSYSEAVEKLPDILKTFDFTGVEVLPIAHDDEEDLQ